jgi:hypothetical protein
VVCLVNILVLTTANFSRHDRPAPPPVQTTVSSGPNGSRIVHLETPGNLQSNHAVGCIAISAASNEYTPADLYHGVGICLRDGEFKDAAELHALASSYGIFDTMRVSDRTAHQAILGLQMLTFQAFSPAEKEQFSREAKRLVHDPEQLARVCREIRTLGPPNYRPDYMIQHGMAAFRGHQANDGIVVGFDPGPAWDKTLTGVLHCPP